MSRFRSERGAILLHVAAFTVALLVLAAMVVDYGMVWVSRSQAQAAADAGALAGARALAFDASLDPANRARNVAWNVAHYNRTWGENTAAIVRSPYAQNPCSANPASCIRVDTFRNGTNGSTLLPSWFAQLFGGANRVRAMAVAEVGTGNTSDCLKPFAVPDYFVDTGSPGYEPGVDTYTSPGYTLSDVGTVVELRNTQEFRAEPGWFRLLDLVDATNGGGVNELRDVIRSCAGDRHGVGDVLDNNDDENGASNGIGAAVEDLIALDPDASYDPVTKKIVDSCADNRSCEGYVWNGSSADGPVPDPGRNYSPRIIPLAIFDPAEFIESDGDNVVITNILGFFITETNWTGSDKFVRGVLINQPGFYDRSRGAVADNAAFVTSVRLIR